MATYDRHTAIDGKLTQTTCIAGRIAVGDVLPLRVGPYQSQLHRIIEVAEVFDAERDRPDDLSLEPGEYSVVRAEVIAGDPIFDSTPCRTGD